MDMQPEKGQNSANLQTAATAASLQAHEAQALAAQQAVLLRTICEFLEQEALESGLLALVNELHHRCKCTRVAVALYRDDKLVPAALSQQAVFDPVSAEVRNIVDAMEEASDQDRLVHWHEERPDPLAPAHAMLAKQTDSEVCTVPMFHQGEAVGVLLLMRAGDKPWTQRTVLMLRQVASFAAPIVLLRMRDERSLGERTRETMRNLTQGLFGPTRLLPKLVISLVVLLLTASAIFTTQHEVGAEAELLPEERRTINAPFAGYIDAVHIQTGDHVAPGTALVSLDTQDLDLQKQRLENELASVQTEFRAAMASRDRKEMAIAQAKQQQVEAELDLVELQIRRAKITATTEGLVTAEDLSQAIGAPVERGKPLLEIAPAQGYKVVLWVDERDIQQVTVGQPGRLVMRSSPADGISITVRDIHPIAYPRGGFNRFRVEATMDTEANGLRPGHTGYGKIAVGEATYLWLATHRFVEWLRLTFWAWFG